MKGKFLLSLLLFIAVFTSCEARSKKNVETVPEVKKEKPYVEAPTPTAPRTVGTVDFTVAAEKALDCVVHVRTTIVTEQRVQDPTYRYFFGIPRERVQRQETASSGSGVILTDDGYIVTNNHVIEHATNISVVLNDKRAYNAKLVGRDPSTDLALLKVEAEEPLPFITVGSSDNLKVGEWVLAVGNPFNLTSTVTAGIVSAKARNINIISADMKIESFIQTDAAVNPGNSGGALVNLDGDLVGINSAIASQTGSFTGYAFAIPVSIMTKVVSDLRTYGVVQRALLGISIQDITSELSKKYSLGTLDGAFVAAVANGSAADAAGIMAGDVIVSVGGTNVKSVAELQEKVSQYSPGEQVTVSYLRNGVKSETTVTLHNVQGGTSTVMPTDNESLGVELEPIPAQISRQYGIEYGVVVGRKTADGKALSQLPQGFIILKVNGKSVRTVADIETMVNNVRQRTGRYDERALLITGILNGRIKYYTVELKPVSR